MAVRSRRYYNDQIGSTFDGLANLFDDPTGAKAAVHARASALRDEAARKNDFAYLAADAGVGRDQLDRAAMAAGLWNPNQSYYNVDQSNATTRRGQDITSQTSIFNNNADNQRALTIGRENNENSIIRAAMDPIAQGQTRFLPPEVAQRLGMPEQQRGILSMSPGEKAILPDGTEIYGNAKPLSETEVKGGVLSDSYQDPSLRDRVVQSVIGSPDVEQVMTPDGPRIVSRADAIGQAPYKAPSSDAARNYRAPDGAEGMLAHDQAGRPIDASTRQPVPQGSVVYSANVQGGKNDVLSSPTINRVQEEISDILKVSDTSKALRAAVQNSPASQGLVGRLRGTVQDVIATGDELSKLVGGSQSILDKAVASGQVSPETAEAYRFYDPSIQTVKLLQMSLAVQYAKFNNPGERMTNELFAHAMNAIGGNDILSNRAQLMASLDAIDSALAQRYTRASYADPEAAAKLGGNPFEQGVSSAVVRPQPTSTPTAGGIPEGAIQALRQSPALSEQFDAKYGTGASAQFLGGQ